MAVRTKSSRMVPLKSGRAGAESPEVDLGLCSTCNNAGHCTYRARNDRPAAFCEEFDSVVPTITNEPAAQSFPTLQEMHEWNEYKGLCINCEKRKDCAILNKEVGIWHCEEYR